MFNYHRFTRFEKTRILSTRTLQISMGAPVLIKNNLNNPSEIVNEELKKKFCR